MAQHSSGIAEVMGSHRVKDTSIARNRGHFAPVINCQRNLIFKMADKDYRSQGKRIPYDILNNLSSVDLFYEDKGKKKKNFFQENFRCLPGRAADSKKTGPRCK